MSAFAALEGRVRLMLGRAIVRLVDDTRTLQEVQVDLLDDESQDAVEHFQPYGLAVHPHLEAEALVVCAGGLRSHAIAIAVSDRRFRLRNLQQGEVALYDDLGNVVKLGRDAITIVAASAINMTAPDGLTINADVTVNGAIEATGDVTAAGISLQHHTHSGVDPGAGNTGEPQ